MENYFTIKELCKSDTAIRLGIDNTPDDVIKTHLEELIKFLNPLRKAWGSPIIVNSGFRCWKLNSAVGGVPTSAHLYGYAVDLIPKYGTMTQFKKFIVNYLKDKKFDQCIIEKTSNNTEWVHLGLKNRFGLQRKQIFKLNV